MKKTKFLFCLAVIAILIGSITQSCQSEDVDLNSPTEEVTAADLFVASEAFQEFQKKSRKMSRVHQKAISKLSVEQLERYYELRNKMYKIETLVEAIEELNTLLGYNYGESLKQEVVETSNLFNNTNFTKLELMKAVLKHQKKAISIQTRSTPDEQYQRCTDYCDYDFYGCNIEALANFEILTRNIPYKYRTIEIEDEDNIHPEQEKYINCWLIYQDEEEGCRQKFMSCWVVCYEAHRKATLED